MNNGQEFKFEISLSVLNHLGRNLYRNFSTVLGEAISNAWDADAKNVWIYIDRSNAALLIKDDGNGMNGDDFQNKFLKIGYSKRKDGSSESSTGRPFIGRKGIGKLALLSCADKIAIMTKTSDSDYVGGVIDNSGLDEAITNDLTPEEYSLENLDTEVFGPHIEDHEHGTIIYFENIKDGIHHTLEHLKKIVALYFRFSLIDESFNIYINDEKVDIDCLDDLVSNTQFLWRINYLEDPYIQRIESRFTSKNEKAQLSVDERIKGFIASVKKPSNLKIMGTGAQVTVDLFVNGRLRETSVLKHIPSARLVESYLYGQIHFDDLDDDEDRFTSSRESVVANDPKFEEFLRILKEDVMPKILDQWDEWRRNHKQDGDPENTSISKKQRKSGELYNAVAEEYTSGDVVDGEVHKVDEWVGELSDDAQFSFSSFAECYIAENLIRKYIKDKSLSLKQLAIDEVTERRRVEGDHKSSVGISIDIRKDNDDLNYLDMNYLSHQVENASDPEALPNKAKHYKPMRDALMHTSLLSDEAKRKLTTVFDDIKARIKSLF